MLGRVGWFVCNPTPKSCVDEKISGFEHANRALYAVLHRANVKEQLQRYNGEGLSLQETLTVCRETSAFAMVNAVCCVKEERPDIHIDKDKPCPKFIPFRCTHGGPNGGKCQNCGIEKKLNILNSLRDLSTDNEVDKVEVKVWKDMPRQGTNSKGEQNTQRELADERWTIERLVDEFKRMLEVCVKH